MYGRDLAHVHDDGFGDFARDAAPGLLALLRDRGIDSGLVVDLGCGSGIWAAALLDAGYDVLGVDISAEMLEIAAAARARPAAGGPRARTGSSASMAAPDPGGGTYRREITTFRHHAGDAWRRTDETHDVWLYDPADTLADLQAAGFEGHAPAGYGERLRFARGHAGFVAMRPTAPAG